MKRIFCLFLATVWIGLMLAGCQQTGTDTVSEPETEAALPAGIKQVVMPRYLSPYYYGEPEDNGWQGVVVFALYEDGTVGVACKEAYRSRYASVTQWRNITEIWLSAWGTDIWGLTEDGAVVTTSGMDVSHLKNVRDLVDGYALLADGSMESLESGEKLPVRNVKKIFPVHPNYDWGSWALCEDGSVYLLNCHDEFGNFVDCEPQNIEDIEDIDIIDLSLCAYQSDGTLYCESLAPEVLERLHGCVKIGEVFGFWFGITENGELKAGSDDAMDYLAQTVESGQYRVSGIKDMLTREQQMRISGMIFLYEDGTVCSVSPELNKIIRNWSDIEKIAWYEGYDTMTLYALRKDGSVIAVESRAAFFEPEPAVYENYKGWILEDMYVEPLSGCIGVCPDGSLVGDYVFEALDFAQIK